jgi:hypothetical protein
MLAGKLAGKVAIVTDTSCDQGARDGGLTACSGSSKSISSDCFSFIKHSANNAGLRAFASAACQWPGSGDACIRIVRYL